MHCTHTHLNIELLPERVCPPVNQVLQHAANLCGSKGGSNIIFVDGTYRTINGPHPAEEVQDTLNTARIKPATCVLSFLCLGCAALSTLSVTCSRTAAGTSAATDARIAAGATSFATLATCASMAGLSAKRCTTTADGKSSDVSAVMSDT